MRTLLLLLSLITVNASASHQRLDPTSILFKTCSSEDHKVSYYRCPFGFCYEVKYEGIFGVSLASSLSMGGPGFVGPNARKVYMDLHLEKALFIKDEGERIMVFTNDNESYELECDQL